VICVKTEQILLAKLERAEQHIYDLEQRWTRFIKHAYRVTSNDDPDTGDRAYRLSEAWDLEHNFSLIIGDAVHCLRSALDHLAYHVMSISPGITDKALGKVYFPIAEDAHKYKTEQRARIEGMRQEAIEAIDRIQPYGGGSGGIFWHLHSLDIIDKHKLLIAVGSTNRLHSMPPSRIKDLKQRFLKMSPDSYSAAEDAILFKTTPTSIKFPLKTGDILTVVPKSEVNEHMNSPLK
jgi:hypothetical protein